jgi:hypothetical protein
MATTTPRLTDRELARLAGDDSDPRVDAPAQPGASDADRSAEVPTTGGAGGSRMQPGFAGSVAAPFEAA